ncbi:hypothetical protein [Streptosporangium longisporum]|uniref:hypothetical protein n=1 Tax=Streptosporangium longisporum TaxID=46187 RepID=UPI0031ED611B
MELTASERHQLKKMAYGHKTSHQARQRATIVLLSARGHVYATTREKPGKETEDMIDDLRTETVERLDLDVSRSSGWA